MSVENLKADARRLAAHLSKKFGYNLSHTAALEALAASRGYKDWNTYRATLSAPAEAPEERLSLSAQPTLNQLAARRGFADWDALRSHLQHLNLPSRADQTTLGRELGITRAHEWVNAIATAKPGSLFVVSGISGAAREESLQLLCGDLRGVGHQFVSRIAPRYEQARDPAVPDHETLRPLLAQAMRQAANVIVIQQENTTAVEYGLIKEALASGFVLVILEMSNAVELVPRLLRNRGLSSEDVARYLKGVLLQRPVPGTAVRNMQILSALHLFDAPERASSLLDDAVHKAERGLVALEWVLPRFLPEEVAAHAGVNLALDRLSQDGLSSTKPRRIP